MSSVPPDWATVRAVLALAAFDPLLAAIGVSRNGAALRQVMRRHYAGTAGHALGDAALAADFADVASAVARAAGSDAAARFEAWACSRFTGLHAAQPAISGWIEVFRAWAFARDLPDALRPSKASTTAIAETASAYRAARAGARDAARAALDGRLDDVDLGIMTAERWLGGDHPAVEIGFMAGAQAFMQAWTQRISPMAERDRALLHDLAQQTLAWRGIEGDLPPLVLREAPTCL